MNYRVPSRPDIVCRSLHGISFRTLDGLCGRLRDTRLLVRREAASSMCAMFRALSADIARGGGEMSMLAAACIYVCLCNKPGGTGYACCVPGASAAHMQPTDFVCLQRVAC